jgi:iron complex outermembrane receptor protein
MALRNHTLFTKAQYILSAIALTFLGALPLTTIAQEKKDSTVIRLHEVVIQSPLVNDSRKLIPASLTIIDKGTLQISPKLDLLQEAEQATPGLFITGKGIMGAGAGPLSSGKISMRGLISSSNSSTQVLIDGVPMMMGLFGHPLTDAIERSNIDRIEVLRGPASMQFGGNALAGAINIISANPAPNTKSLSASMDWGSFGTVKRSFSASVGKESYFIQAGYSHNATDGYRENSAFTSDDYYFRSGINFSKHFQRTFSIYRSNSTTNDPGSIDAPLLTVTHVQRTLAAYKLTNNYQGLKGGLTLYYQDGINHFSDGWNSKDYLGGARLEEQFSLFTGNTILAGSEARWYGGKGSPVGFPTSVLNDVWIKQTEQSAFITMQQKAGELLSLNAGVRTDHHSLFGFTTSPSAGATFAVGNTTLFRGLFSRGFRNPTIGELYYFPPANSTLKPEKAGNIELGVTSKLLNDRLSIDLTLFSTKASDLIFTVPSPGSVPPVKNLNAKKVSNTGLELSTHFVIGAMNQNAVASEGQTEVEETTAGTSEPDKKDHDLTITNNGIFSTALVSINYMYLQQNETPLPYSPKHKLSAQLQTAVKRLRINLEYQYISGMYTDYPALTLTKYSVVDLAFLYPIMRRVQLKVTGNNLFDEKYQIMKGYPMPGRILMGGILVNLFK